MATPVFFECFLLDLGLEKHNFSADSIRIALLAAADAPSVSADAVLADVTQIASIANLSASLLTTTSWAQVLGVATLIIADFNVLAAGGTLGPFRYIVIYNDSSAADALICYYDIGSDVTLLDTQQITMDFNGTTGMLQLTPP